MVIEWDLLEFNDDLVGFHQQQMVISGIQWDLTKM